MSWLQTNYEKAALGGAVVVALGLAFMGWSKYGNVENDFASAATAAGKNSAAVQNADLIPKAVSSLKSDRVWEPAIYKDRPVDLFVGIPLFIPSAAPTTTVDPWRDAPIHPPIPNKWWLDHKLDPGYADSPARDPDGDGFSNLEEYLGKTDPMDPKSFPSLIAKLMYVRDESLTWAIRPSYGSDGKFPFNYVDDKKGQNKTGAADMIAPGGLFFAKGIMKDRFKFLGSEVRQEMSPKTNIPMAITYVRIEDQKDNKKGTVYEIPAPLSEERLNEHRQYDRTAVMSLEALGLSGQDFKVEENLTFALPPDAPKKDYLLKKVTPESITVEYTDGSGEKKTVEIPKGATPHVSE
jgi:hypothetical protein